MRVAAFVPVFAAAALAQSASPSSSAAVSSFTGDAFPQTSFLTQTNSLGVITGQPPVATSIPNQPNPVLSQPPVATSQPPVASLPIFGTGVHTYLQGIPGTNQTSTIVLSVGTSGTAVVTSLLNANTASSNSRTGTAGGSDSQTTGTRTGTGAAGASSTSSTGAAATMKAMAGSLVGAGALMAAFL